MENGKKSSQSTLRALHQNPDQGLSLIFNYKRSSRSRWTAFLI